MFYPRELLYRSVFIAQLKFRLLFLMLAVSSSIFLATSPARGQALDQQIKPPVGERSRHTTRFDFDGDRKADISIFHPSSGEWFCLESSGDTSKFQFGMAGDTPVADDYDGDGKTDFAIYRGGVWYQIQSSTGTIDSVSFGLPTDVPVPGDYDGDGKADVAVFRPEDGTWWISVQQYW